MTVQSIFYSSNYFWVSDGTATGTQSILGAPLQINPNLITFGNYVIFDVQSINGGGIYKTDGTTAGTQLLASFTKFADSVQSQAVIGAKDLMVTFSDQLWVTDGTPSGTQMLSFTTVPPTFTWGVYSNLYSLGSEAIFAATTVHSNYLPDYP